MEMTMEDQNRSVDLNCDMGESEDEVSIARDIALMDRISSVNIACGFHAGNPGLMSLLSRAAFVRGIAVGTCGEDLILYGLSGSALLKQAEKVGLQTASEVFCDRTYRDDGSLTPRNEKNALIRDAGTAAAQVEMMVEKGLVKTVSRGELAILAETVCIHSDGPDALGFATAISQLLSAKGIAVSAPALRPTNL